MLTILQLLRLIDDGKGKKGVAKKRVPKPHKFPKIFKIILKIFACGAKKGRNLA